MKKSGLFVVWRPDDFAYLEFHIKWEGRMGMAARRRAKAMNKRGRKYLSYYDKRTRGAKYLKDQRDIAWKNYPKPTHTSNP